MSTVPPPPSDEARIAASLDNWKRKLLDLSKRNRALNFRMTRVSTVAIVDEQPAEVFRRLYLQEKPMRFRAAAEDPAPPATSGSTVSAPASSTEAQPVSASPIVESTDDTLPAPTIIASAPNQAVADTSAAGSSSPDAGIAAAGTTAADGDGSTVIGGSSSADAVGASAEAVAEDADRGVASGGSIAGDAGSSTAMVGSPSADDVAAVATGGSPSADDVDAVAMGGSPSADDAVAAAGDAGSAAGAGDAARGATPASGNVYDAMEEDAAAQAFAPYEAAALTEKHRDDTLQTTAPAELLDRSLRRIDEQARETVAEQGVNTLFLALGMLHYREKGESETHRAPLVLLPVQLARKSAATGYTVAAAEDDPIVNPALAEYLRRDHGVVLPDLPDPSAITDDYDLQSFLAAATDAVAKQDGWKVTTEIYLGLFAFQKFAMYRDLEANGGGFAAHRLIRQLVTRQGDALIGLPDDVRALHLDDTFPPESSAQVVDADSSQLRAIVAVSLGHDLVLEGPPGTGKSQTITNLIAQALAAGQSVLFVAEKMAALSVVHARLVRAGLGDFCLELHSTKASKRAVIKEIARSLDASLQRPRAAEDAAARLPAVRGALTAYADAVHTPFGAAGFTPYRGFGELMALRDAPRVRLTAPIDGVTREMMEEAARSLEELGRAVAGVGDPARHPWRDSTRTLWTEDELEEARDLLAALRAALADVARHGAEVSAAFGLPPVRTLGDVRTALQVAEVMRRSPGAPVSVLTSDAWNAPPREAQELIDHGRRLAALREHVGQRFTDQVLQQDHAADIAFLLEREGSVLRWANALNGRHREIKQRWTAYRLPSYGASLVEQAQEMKRVDELRRAREWLAQREGVGRSLFGALWFGEASDWEALEGYVRWVVEFRGIAVAHRLDAKAAQVAAAAAPDVSLAAAFRDAAERAAGAVTLLRDLAGFPADWLAGAPLDEIGARAAELESGLALAPRWAAFEPARRRVADGLAGELLAPALSGVIPFADLPRAFRRAFHQKWVTAAVQERPALREFATLTHEQRVEEFRTLDEQVLRENRDALVARLREVVQKRLREDEAKAAMPFLQREMARERRHAPLRRTLQQSGAAIRAIKPCFMMSPLTVAQLLDGGRPSFDLVIFDEASQLPSEDAVGAIVRGSRLVVVGDPKQLPPTNFFSVMAGEEVRLADDGSPLFEDTESVLEEFLGAGVPRTRLRWHYRSTHESLITFSNVSFYDADLHTFPSVETDSHALGLVFRHVPDGVYEGKGLNPVEARAVADEVVRHALETPELSLGVGTFNLRQQLAIQDELEARRRADPALEPFFSRERPEPFFVKNLENIQGDERDVILLSVTYAKGRDGRLRNNFGPINGENGWRRLNVLTTRARQRMVVFSSMKGDDIIPAGATSRGPALLRDFLLYAERGRLDAPAAAPAAEADSLFEAEVAAELARRGLRLQPQVGVAGYRIDLAVLDDEVEGRYVCGIECDGVAYHASETARDRDRLRQQVLEARGWEIHRLWSVDWFKDRDGQIERLLALVEASRLRTRAHAAAETQAEADAAARAAAASITEPPAAPATDPAPESESESGLASETRSVDAPPVDPPAPAPLAAVQPADAAPSEAPTIEAAPTESPARSEPAAPPEGPLSAQPYRKADDSPRHEGSELGTASPELILRAIDEVLAAEAPVHMEDMVDRIASMWGLSRLGTRVMGRVDYALNTAEGQGRLERRGEFLWLPGGAFAVRTRAGTGIPAERIPPEEYREAAVQVLRATGPIPRKELTNRVRALLGFSRTGPRLEESISAALDTLLADGTAGEASTGIALRE